ncbi:hypothetical protein [Pseudoalteromonas 'SMAR']|uniref:hypothetical protein n=1 Tax=Pseudoalteromonas 'SMAR' TaxID=3416908 RepID=UPI003AF2D6C9
MKKSLISALVFAPLFAGCVSTSDTNTSANLDRNAAVAELTTRMDTLGYQHPVDVVPGINEFLNAAAIVLERQYKVIGQYRTQTDHYRDVQAFLYSHQNSTPEQLEAAIIEFDKGAQSKEQEIGYKIAAYNLANESIYEQNVELATDLAIEVAKSAYILSQYKNEVATAVTMSAGSSLMSMFSEKEEQAEDPQDIGTALLKAKDQLSLALEANELIELEQATITAINELQLEQEAKG